MIKFRSLNDTNIHQKNTTNAPNCFKTDFGTFQNVIWNVFLDYFGELKGFCYICSMKKAKANKKVSVTLMADFVILFCQNLGVTISAIKLQKLLYYVQAWHIAKFDKEILFDTLPEAWANGPVYREVYNNYKTTFFKNENIVTNLEEAQLSEKLQLKKNELDLNTKQLELIISVLDLYSKLRICG